MTVEEKMEALGATPLFTDFTDTGKRIFASVAQEKRIPAGAPLFAENMVGESLFVVVSGGVRLSQKRPEGGEREAGQVGAGEVLGELAVLSPTVRLVSAVAAAETVVLEIGQRDFLALAPQKPQACLKLATAIAAVLARRLGESRDLLRETLARTAAP
ncbi:MAG: cyclic nucleotide-binding domain-containing protein [Deltaproteobacteria bacterium]|nr:cyclic nucleotide-binding domain-containing protein [Deltaproteobacteria bacterium]